MTTSKNLLQYFPLSDVASVGNVSLDTQLDTGGSLSHAEVDQIVLNNNQAYLSREYGGILVVNLDKAGDPSAVAVDYFIADVPNPRGLAYDGRYLYVVEEGDEDGTWHRYLLILDLSTLTPLTGNATTLQVDKDDDGLLVAAIEVGKTPEEVLLTSVYAFVTNQEDNTVSVISLATQTKVMDIPIGENTEPFSMALYTLPDGTEKYLYVGNVESNTITIIDIPTLTVVGTFP